MRDFGTEEAYTSSIAIDASTRGNVTVASAVHSTRDSEVDILQTLIDEFDDINVDFIPFQTKSKHIDKDTHESTYRGIIRRNEEHLSLLHFPHHSAKQNQHYTEAVLAAILSEEIVARVHNEPLIIIDGDQNLVNTFGKAYYEIAGELPSVTNCVQSERYYPQSLLADLSAGFASYRIENELYDYDEPIIRAKAVDATFPEKWGRAFDFLQRNPGLNVDRVPVKTGYSDTVEGRAELWYAGGMGRSFDNESSIELRTVISRIEQMGYPDVAQALSEL